MPLPVIDGIYTKLQRLMQGNRHFQQTAINDLKRSYEYNNENGDALYNLGNAYYKSGDTTSAIEIYEDVIEKFPNTEKARKSKGYIEEIRGG